MSDGMFSVVALSFTVFFFSVCVSSVRKTGDPSYSTDETSQFFVISVISGLATGLSLFLWIAT